MYRIALPLLGLITLIPTSTVVAHPANPVNSTSGGSDNLVALHLEVGTEGAPLHGLTTADFEVRDKGKKVTIVDVIEVNETTEAEAYPEEKRRQVVFLFDLELSDPAQAIRAIDLAREALAVGLPVGGRAQPLPSVR